MINKKSYFSVIAGNLIEWYEFSLYGYLASIFAVVFFPFHHQNQSIFSLTWVFSTYAISFMMRPIGGLILGYYADRYSRKLVLIISMSMLMVLTFCIGILPGYQTIGILSPLFLILLRLLQGFLISAEYVGATVYQAENFPHRSGFHAVFIQSGALIGGLLASLSVLLLTFFFSKSMIQEIGWRIPYLLGAFFSLLMLFWRIKLPNKDSKDNLKSLAFTWKKLLKYKKMSLLRAFLIPAAATASVYYFIYEITFLVTFLKKDLSTSLSIEIISKCLLFFSLPFFAHWADKVGHKKFLIKSLIILIVFAYPLFYLMSQNNLYALLIGQTLFALLASPLLSVNMVYVTSLFEKEERVTASSSMINLSIAVFGATTPLISLFLIKTGNHVTPVFYYLFACVLSLMAMKIE